MVSADSPEDQDSSGLSYKFQRLREKLRLAITDGQLSGKLPGERALAKQFHVNAKTLSKALTDLAAEGLLDRSIGRGTYVKGSSPSPTAGKRWLIVCDPEQRDWEIISLLKQSQPELEVITEVQSLRPSFLNQFAAVIDLARDTLDSFIRDLVVRNITVVAVGREPRIFSTHAVVFDGLFAVTQLGRHLMSQGHRKLAAIEPPHCTIVASTLRRTAELYAPDATVDACFASDVVAMVGNGITAFVCQSICLATQAKELLERAQIAIPGTVSIGAIGCTSEDQPVSGICLNREKKAAAIVELLNDRQLLRPTTLWLAGQYVDHGTIGPVPSPGKIGSEDEDRSFELVAQ